MRRRNRLHFGSKKLILFDENINEQVLLFLPKMKWFFSWCILIRSRLCMINVFYSPNAPPYNSYCPSDSNSKNSVKRHQSIHIKTLAVDNGHVLTSYNSRYWVSRSVSTNGFLLISLLINAQYSSNYKV